MWYLISPVQQNLTATQTPKDHSFAEIFADPHWAAIAVPTHGRRHRRFYQHLLTTLGIGYDSDDIPSIRNFDPLPEAIREQATWGRLLSDPDWGTLIESRKTPRVIPFMDITRGYGRTA